MSLHLELARKENDCNELKQEIELVKSNNNEISHQLSQPVKEQDQPVVLSPNSVPYSLYEIYLFSSAVFEIVILYN